MYSGPLCWPPNGHRLTGKTSVEYCPSRSEIHLGLFVATPIPEGSQDDCSVISPRVRLRRREPVHVHPKSGLSHQPLTSLTRNERVSGVMFRHAPRQAESLGSLYLGPWHHWPGRAPTAERRCKRTDKYGRPHGTGTSRESGPVRSSVLRILVEIVNSGRFWLVSL
jgi:hypothetical protein